MKVIFCRSHTPSSWLVRLLTWSEWSHVVLVHHDGVHAVEAVWPRVRETTVDKVAAHNAVCELVDFPCQFPHVAYKWAQDQVGKWYDLSALFGFIIHRDMAHPGRWFCSELVAEAFHQGWSPLFREALIDRITPQDLWKLPGKDASQDGVA